MFPTVRSLTLVLAASLIVSGCKEIATTLKPDKGKPESTTWQGSPLVEWESPKFTHEVILRGIYPGGIFAYEGNMNGSAQFRTEKGVLLTYDDGRLVWKKALRPHFTNPISPFSSRTVFVPYNKEMALVTWVKGDLFRAQDCKTGEDLWNRPACQFPVKVKGFVAGYCFRALHLLDPKTGRPRYKFPIRKDVVELFAMGDGVLLLHPGGEISYIELPGGKVHELEKRPNIKHAAVVGGRAFLLYKEGYRLILEMLTSQKQTLYQGPVKSSWKISLSLFPTTFWVHVQDDAVILPTGLDCMMSRTLASGTELWTSCGVYLFNPPAYDEFGMYMLSSRERDGVRPILFVDGDNGLQTNLFQTNASGSVNSLSGKFIAPGKIRYGMIYAIHKSEKVVGIRIAAPETKEQTK